MSDEDEALINATIALASANFQNNPAYAKMHQQAAAEKALK